MAIEQFREWNPKGKIKVMYSSSDGTKKLWEIEQELLLQQILALVEKYMEQDIKLINRQLYYRLVALKVIPNAIQIYKRICTFLTDARYGGELDWKAIEDRGRAWDMHAEWKDVKSLIESAVLSYRKRRWKDQEYYIELMCEKQSLESVFQPVAEEFHIGFSYNKGYSSASAIYELAERVKKALVAGKHVIVFYWGDHGLDMVRDIKDRIVEFVTMGDDPLDDVTVFDMFDVIQLGLNMDQIKKYNPPPDPAKRTDPRAKAYIKEFGHVSWELDALEPTVLREITKAAILEYLDIELYNKIVAEEQTEIQKLREFGDALVSGNNGGG